MIIDSNRIIEEQLAACFGLKQYAYIITQMQKVDISADDAFQTKFNGFYRVRRNVEWRRYYYELFESGKTRQLTFADILTYLYEKTGNIEPSFSSKMNASLKTDEPIWDQYVLKNLGLELHGQGKEKLTNAISLYAEIEKWYQDFLGTQNAKDCIAAFDKVLPSYQWISATKKIDCFLWRTR